MNRTLKSIRVGFALPIQTVYYNGKKMVKKTRAGTANRAVPHAVSHMQINEYGATHCEVYDLFDGVLHAVLRRHVGHNEIDILFKREVKEGM